MVACSLVIPFPFPEGDGDGEGDGEGRGNEKERSSLYLIALLYCARNAPCKRCIPLFCACRTHRCEAECKHKNVQVWQQNKATGLWTTKNVLCWFLKAFKENSNWIVPYIVNNYWHILLDFFYFFCYAFFFICTFCVCFFLHFFCCLLICLLAFWGFGWCQKAKK